MQSLRFWGVSRTTLICLRQAYVSLATFAVTKSVKLDEAFPEDPDTNALITVLLFSGCPQNSCQNKSTAVSQFCAKGFNETAFLYGTKLR